MMQGGPPAASGVPADWIDQLWIWMRLREWVDMGMDVDVDLSMANKYLHHHFVAITRSIVMKCGLAMTTTMAIVRPGRVGDSKARRVVATHRREKPNMAAQLVVSAQR